MQGLVETGSLRSSLQFVNFKVLSGKTTYGIATARAHEDLLKLIEPFSEPGNDRDEMVVKK
jgi:hypothetical protein